MRSRRTSQDQLAEVARRRLELLSAELAVAAAEGHQVDVSVAHLANPERAQALADHLRQRLAENLAGRDVPVGEVGAVIGAHVGPGMVAVVVSPH